MKIETNNIYNTDCINLMSSMEAESVNLIITDPPYGINFTHDHKTYNRDPKNVLKGYQEIETSDYLDFTKEWVAGASRVLKDDGTMYIVSGYTHLREILNVLHDTDLHLVSSLVWKYNFGVYATKKWINSHYHILMVAKDPKKSNTIHFNGILRSTGTRAANLLTTLTERVSGR